MIDDFHCHSNWSDGTYSTEQLIALAIKENIKHLSITDHDAVGDTLNALSLSKKNNIDYVSGIELSCKDVKHLKKVHILGYAYDINNSYLIEYCDRIGKDRNKLAFGMIEKINRIGYNLKKEDFFKRLNKKKIIYKQHIMEQLLIKGYTDSIYGSLFKFFETKGVFKEPVPYLPYDEGIKLIIEAGGIPVVAHIGVYNNWGIIEELIKSGIKGIEVYHYNHTREDIRRALAIAKKFNLVITGGSDFHGKFGNKGATTLGMPIKRKYINKFLKLVRQHEVTREFQK